MFQSTYEDIFIAEITSKTKGSFFRLLLQFSHAIYVTAINPTLHIQVCAFIADDVFRCVFHACVHGPLSLITAGSKGLCYLCISLTEGAAQCARGVLHGVRGVIQQTWRLSHHFPVSHYLHKRESSGQRQITYIHFFNAFGNSEKHRNRSECKRNNTGRNLK